jgi:hypothetical protein
VTKGRPECEEAVSIVRNPGERQNREDVCLDTGEELEVD